MLRGARARFVSRGLTERTDGWACSAVDARATAPGDRLRCAGDATYLEPRANRSPRHSRVRRAGFRCWRSVCTRDAGFDPGTACAADDDCVSRRCASSVCCDQRCDGGCESCSLPGSLGQCTPLPALSPGSSSCGPHRCELRGGPFLQRELRTGAGPGRDLQPPRSVRLWALLGRRLLRVRLCGVVRLMQSGGAAGTVLGLTAGDRRRSILRCICVQWRHDGVPFLVHLRRGLQPRA
jgi:hypothetical protein